MKQDYIKTENGDMFVTLSVTSTGRIVNPIKNIKLIIEEFEVNYNNDGETLYATTLTEKQALEIASMLINAVSQDKRVTKGEIENHIKILQKYNK
jgi:hypothetical protein